MRVADYIFEHLAQTGVTDVFTVIGGGCIFLADALGGRKDTRYYCTHHEQAAVMAAESYARVKGRLGVALVTVGPGSTNAITGVAGAWLDSVPLLVLSGQAFSSQTVGDSGLRQVGLQEVDILKLIPPITKYAVSVREPQSIRYHLEAALSLAQTGRPGPVWIEIPADIQNAQVDSHKMPGYQPTPVGLDYDKNLREKVSQVVSLLRSSKRPLIHVGQGVRIAGVIAEFLELVEAHRIPFVTARNANDIVASNHPLLVGRPGMYGQRAANFAVQAADVYLAVGTRLNLGQTNYNTKDYARNATKIAVDVDRIELFKPTLDFDLRVHHDAGAFLNELASQLKGAELNTGPWVEKCQEWKAKYPVVLPRHREQQEFVNSYYLIEVLSQLLTAGDIVVTDMGAAFQGTHQAFEVKSGQRLFTNCGCASMGWGLPAAVGASVAADRHRVVCLSGDGGVQMNIQELATVMHHQLPVKLFVQSNGGYLTMKQTQQAGCGGRLMGCSTDTGLSFPDYLKLAEAHNIPACRLTSHRDLAEQVLKVLEHAGPYLCDVVMDQNQEQEPRLIPRKTPEGKTEPMAFEDMYPFLPKEEIAQAMSICETDKK